MARPIQIGCQRGEMRNIAAHKKEEVWACARVTHSTAKERIVSIEVCDESGFVLETQNSMLW